MRLIGWPGTSQVSVFFATSKSLLFESKSSSYLGLHFFVGRKPERFRLTY
jgi:hypothetical protein